MTYKFKFAMQISVSGNGQKYLGTSPLLMGQFSANNGQIIAMTAYPPGNQGINSTSVLGCSAIQDFGPFNINQVILARRECQAVLSCTNIQIQQPFASMRQSVIGHKDVLSYFHLFVKFNSWQIYPRA